MRNPNVSRVQRLLNEVLISIETARAEASRKDRKIVGVLDRLIDEIRETITDLNKEPEKVTFSDLFGLLKIVSVFVDLLRGLFDTLSCKTNHLLVIIDKYTRYRCRLVRISKYLELMLGSNRRNWQISLGRKSNI